MTESDAILEQVSVDVDPRVDPLVEAKQRYNALPDALFNDPRPDYVARTHEKPEHRMMIMLKAQGLSNHEIAVRLGYSDYSISITLRQPWARLRLLEEFKIAGRDAVAEMLKAAAEDSVFTMLELRDNPTTPAAVKKAVCSDLLDRYLGKPTQKIEQRIGELPSTDDVAEMQRELENLEAETRRIRGN